MTRVERRAFLVGTLAILAAPLAAEAQGAGKVARIGILSPSPANAGRVEAIRQGLLALGHVEGRTSSSPRDRHRLARRCGQRRPSQS